MQLPQRQLVQLALALILASLVTVECRNLAKREEPATASTAAASSPSSAAVSSASSAAPSSVSAAEPAPSSAAASVSVAAVTPSTTRKPSELEVTLKQHHEQNVKLFNEFINKTREGKFSEALNDVVKRLSDGVQKVLPDLAPQTSSALGISPKPESGVEAKAAPAAQSNAANPILEIPVKINEFFANMFKQLNPEAGKKNPLEGLFGAKGAATSPSPSSAPPAPSAVVETSSEKPSGSSTTA